MAIVQKGEIMAKTRPTRKVKITTSLKSVPFPNPKTIEETQKNLRYFREKKDIKIQEVADAFGVAYSVASAWEIIQKSKGESPQPIVFKFIDKAATFLNCNPDLINPACPLLYKGQFKTYYPVYGGGKSGKRLVKCVESPITKKDFVNNVDYFIVRSCLHASDIAKSLDVEPSTVSNWRRKNLLKEEYAIKLAKILSCPKELIYLPKLARNKLHKKSQPAKAPIELKLESPAITVKDAKSNLCYHMRERRLYPVNLAHALGLPEDNSNLQTIRNWLSFSKNVYMDTEQAVMISKRLDIPVYDIIPAYEDSQITANASGLCNVDFSKVLELKATSFVSGGAIVDLLPSQGHETVAELLGLPSNGSLAAAQVIGDSMYDYETGSGIKDGSCILINLSKRSLEDALDKVVCFQVTGDELLVKRIKKKNNKLYFWSDNPRYIPQCHELPPDAVLLGVVELVLNKPS